MRGRRVANTRKASDRTTAVVGGAKIALRERPRAWRDQHFYSLFSSLGRLAARPWASALTILVIGVALSLPLLFFVALDQARGLSEGMREARDITVFLKPSAADATANAFANELRARGDVATVTLHTPEDGMREFRRLSGFDRALDVLGANPLPYTLVIAPAGSIDADEPALVGALRSDPRIDLVQYDAVWRQRLGAILDFGTRVVSVLAVLLAIAALLVIGNTVRLDIQGRREEIAVMQLVGASNGFVRRPFLYSGFWYGLGGGIIAVMAVAAIGAALGGPLQRLLANYDQQAGPLGYGMSASLMLIVIGASALLGWLGAWLVASSHLGNGSVD